MTLGLELTQACTTLAQSRRAHRPAWLCPQASQHLWPSCPSRRCWVMCTGKAGKGTAKQGRGFQLRRNSRPWQNHPRPKLSMTVTAFHSGLPSTVNQYFRNWDLIEIKRCLLLEFVSPKRCLLLEFVQAMDCSRGHTSSRSTWIALCQTKNSRGSL